MNSKKASSCAICDNLNRASICTVCVNYRLNEYQTLLKSLKSHRDLLFSKLSQVLVAKGKADDQLNWKVHQNEKLANLREKLRQSKQQLAQGNAKIESLSYDLKVKYGVLESALSMLEKNRKEQLEKFYPNLICTQSLGHMAITSERLHKQSVIIKQICKLFPQRRVNLDGGRRDGSTVQYDLICNARLPRGLDPHSVPLEELAASLGYMVQLLNLVVHVLAAPALHNSGFAGSCSRIWQRDSYWDARPSSRSNEYPLFIPRQNYCSPSGDNSWTERSSSNFVVASMEYERKPRLDSSGSNSFNYSSASPHSVETHKDLQKGISLLFIPRQNYCSPSGDNAWTERSSSNLVVASMEYERKPRLDSSGSNSFNYSSASPHSVETHKDLQKGISLLKKSVACITSYCYNSLCLDVPTEASTFEAFSKLLATLSSSKEIRSVFSLKMACSRSGKQVQQLNKSVWNMNSTISSSTLLESVHALPITKSISNHNLRSSAASFLYATEISDIGKNESLIDEWDFVEHPTLPPPPSQTEDVEHWTRAMFIDATKR